MLCTSGFMDDVMFARNGKEQANSALTHQGHENF